MHSPRGHVHMEMATKSMSEEILWSSSRTVELIELYEAHPCLYNTKLKEYHDRNLKSKALVSRSFREWGLARETSKAWGEISTVLSVPGKSPITCNITHAHSQ